VAWDHAFSSFRALHFSAKKKAALESYHAAVSAHIVAYQIAFRAVFLRPARPCALADYFLHLGYNLLIGDGLGAYAFRNSLLLIGVTSATVSAKDATALASFDLGSVPLRLRVVVLCILVIFLSLTNHAYASDSLHYPASLFSPASLSLYSWSLLFFVRKVEDSNPRRASSYSDAICPTLSATLPLCQPS